MKKILFVTTFSSNGYYVYGQDWMKSFAKYTKKYPNIQAKVYVDSADIRQLETHNRIDIVDFDLVLPEHLTWKSTYQTQSTHDRWNQELAIKFSFKSFVMMDAIRTAETDYVIWLDADCIFLSDDFDNFPTNITEDNFLACQREDSNHIESGIVIFNLTHPDKSVFLNKFTELYTNPDEYNQIPQFFDGYAISKTLDITGINYVDLNQGYGVSGIQSDPSHTFLHPEIKKRFLHNIGITGKRKYESWEAYSKNDRFFQLIHGADPRSLAERQAENLDQANRRIAKLLNRVKSNN